MARNNQFYDMILDDEQVAFVDAIKDLSKTIVFCDAPAGTGKTTLAMGAANILVQDKRNKLDGIVYIVSPYGEGKQGYLPGSITETAVKPVPEFLYCRRFDQTIVADDRRRDIAMRRYPELVALERCMANSIVPVHFRWQFYDLDAEV